MMTDEQMRLISSIGEMVKSDAGTSEGRERILCPRDAGI